MIKIDLVTGFLGAGKTTFILQYARHLISTGEKIAILENDYGAVNIDALLLAGLESDLCEIETVAGGCDHDCHVRRFRTKLISMGMRGFNRVIVEPSGIFDVDEFFDVLHDEPLEQWYEAGNVIAVMDAHTIQDNLSREARYFFMSETAQAGILLLSHIQKMDHSHIRYDAISFVNRSMEMFGCDRRYGDKDILVKDWAELTEEDYDRITSCGFHLCDHIKMPLEDNNDFSSVYFMNHSMTVSTMERIARDLFHADTTGSVFRVKGFHFENGSWYELNASGSGCTVNKSIAGQEVFIVIGEYLVESEIRKLVEKAAMAGDD